LDLQGSLEALAYFEAVAQYRAGGRTGGYALALQPACSAVEVTSVVNEAILRKWPNFGWPSPADLRELLREVRARDRVIGSGRAAGDCRLCGGTGFEVILQRGARVAAPCRCRAPKGEERAGPLAAPNP
jgi:hypothetical protein